MEELKLIVAILFGIVFVTLGPVMVIVAFKNQTENKFNSARKDRPLPVNDIGIIGALLFFVGTFLIILVGTHSL